MLERKKILLGVCGSIAAYKAAFLVRLLVQQGAKVQVLMTQTARAFITPLTLATLSNRPVYSDLYDPVTGEWSNHVELGLWADAYVLAPLSAATLAKLATGCSDNLVTTTYLSARCPVFVCPAMDLDMYRHPAVQRNLELLRTYGNVVLEAEHGELASGLTGQGRMAEPETILETLARHLHPYATA